MGARSGWTRLCHAKVAADWQQTNEHFIMTVESERKDDNNIDDNVNDGYRTATTYNVMLSLVVGVTAAHVNNISIRSSTTLSTKKYEIKRNASQ